MIVECLFVVDGEFDCCGDGDCYYGECYDGARGKDDFCVQVELYGVFY